MMLKDIITCPKLPEGSLTNLMDVNRFCICTGCKLQEEVRGVRTILTASLSAYHASKAAYIFAPWTLLKILYCSRSCSFLDR